MSRLFPNKYSGDNERAENDQYFTPSQPVWAFCLELEQHLFRPFLPKNVLDPCAGTGVWGQTWKSLYGAHRLYGMDIDDTLEKPEGYDGWQSGDFLTSTTGNFKADLIISNPPFNQAEAFVHRAHEVANEYATIAFLLPLAFMSTIGRFGRLYNTYDKRPSNIIVSSRRIDFTGQGNPHTEVAMFVWTNESWEARTQISWIDWKNAEKDEYFKWLKGDLKCKEKELD